MGFLSPKVSNLHCSFNRTYYYHYVKKVVDSQVFLNLKFSYIKKQKAAARKKSNQAVRDTDRTLLKHRPKAIGIERALLLRRCIKKV